MQQHDDGRNHIVCSVHGCPIRAKIGLNYLSSAVVSVESIYHVTETRFVGVAFKYHCSDINSLPNSATIEASQSNVKIKTILTLVSHGYTWY